MQVILRLKDFCDRQGGLEFLRKEYILRLKDFVFKLGGFEIQQGSLRY